MQILIGKIRISRPWNLYILKIGFVGVFNSTNLVGCVNVNLLGHVSVNFVSQVFPILPIYQNVGFNKSLNIMDQT